MAVPRRGGQVRLLLLLLLPLAQVPLLGAAASAGAGVRSLTEEDFAAKLQASTSALVAFVAPWCPACRTLMQEMVHVHSALAHRSSRMLVAMCDVSRETRLAARYHAWRTPIVLLFPDTRVLAPSLQVPFVGQLLHKDLIAFATNALSASAASGMLPPRLGSVADVRRTITGFPSSGMFVGFFRSGDEDGPLEGFWTLDCVRRHARALALAHGPGADSSKDLWGWAGLAWDEQRHGSEEAIVFVPSAEGQSQSRECVGRTPIARFELSSAQARAPWRDQVEAFCAWCERQVLAPVAVFDAPRAAALDSTFEWLLLLFAPRRPAATAAAAEAGDPQQRFPLERERLERFVVAACAKDARYREVLPVLVPRGDDEIAAFRGDLGLDQRDPSVPMAQEDVPESSPGAPAAAVRTVSSELCSSLRDLAAAGEGGAGPRGRLSAPWGVVLFNTRTRRRYLEPSGAGWCPGDEVALCHFTDSVLNGRVLPHMKSEDAPVAEGPAASFQSADLPPGVLELVGKTFGTLAVEPVAAGEAEVLLFLYAPWCSHSINFAPLWHRLAAGIDAAAGNASESLLAGGAGGEAGGGGLVPSTTARRLVVAQMDATRNEHLSLPPVGRFPTVLLGVKSAGNASRSAISGQAGGAADSLGVDQDLGVTFLAYAGDASLIGLTGWLAKYSVFSPPL